MGNRNDDKNDFWATPNGFMALALCVFGIWLGNFFAMPYFFPTDGGGTGNAGTAGDMFGGITALFSGLAFAGLVTALFMQRKELSLQREELRETRKVFSVQRFENTFFGLLRLLNEHIQSIEISNSTFNPGVRKSDLVRGRDALKRFATHIPTRSDGKVSAEAAITQYQEYYDDYLESDLGPYFRLIYNILRHIETADFGIGKADESTKLIYSKILRAHLNSSEVKLLMFNCASVHGKRQKRWIEKHSLLRHITRDDSNKYKKIIHLYEPIAFQFDKRK